MSEIIELELIEDIIEVEIQGDIVFNQLTHSWVDVPAGRDSSGTPGEMSFDDDYLYICVGPNRWARIMLTKGW